MRYLLARASRPILQQLAQEKTLCAFDFDGTLAPIVANPDAARLRDTTRQLLRRLASLYPCVILSGRARADVLGRMQGVNVAGVIGNHGAETEQTTRIPPHRIRQWKAVLQRELGSLPGLWIEDKGLSLSVHYRQSARKLATRRRILEVARRLKRVRVVGGKHVVNLTPQAAPHKGQALAFEKNRLECNWILYVGDDETDEDAFALGGNVVSVRIHRKQRSQAAFYLQAQAEIDALLELLCSMRSSNMAPHVTSPHRQ